jgi:hypothetical protein
LYFLVLSHAATAAGSSPLRSDTFSRLGIASNQYSTFSRLRWLDKCDEPERNANQDTFRGASNGHVGQGRTHPVRDILRQVCGQVLPWTIQNQALENLRLLTVIHSEPVHSVEEFQGLVVQAQLYLNPLGVAAIIRVDVLPSI